MGFLNNPPFSIQEAQQRGVDVYEVLYQDWGRATAPSPIDQWPIAGESSIPISLAGIAIGPRSTVDRAWVTYNLQKTFNAPAEIIATQLTSRIRQVSVDAPLLFTQAAAPQTQNTPGAQYDEILTMNSFGSMYIWPRSCNPASDSGVIGNGGTEIYNPQVAATNAVNYLDINGIVRPIGPNGDPVLGVGTAGWVGPLLHLYLFLKTPVVVPTKRAPLKASQQVAALADGNEHLIAQIATFGRRTVHLMVTGNAISNYRVGALRVLGAHNTHGAGDPDPGIAWEEPMDSATAVGANVRTILANCNASNVLADYINIYATSSAGGSATYNYTISAYD